MANLKYRVFLFILRMWVSFVGIRFYEGIHEPINYETIRTAFFLINGEKIEFRFYRETFTDRLFRNGSFKEVKTHAFLVKPMFHPSLGAKVMRFDGSHYLFRGNIVRFFPDKVLADVILDVYIRYLERHFQSA